MDTNYPKNYFFRKYRAETHSGAVGNFLVLIYCRLPILIVLKALIKYNKLKLVLLVTDVISRQLSMSKR